jgi:hypothetical protein
MASERDHLVSTISKITNSTKQFQTYLEKLETQAGQINVQIQQTLRNESQNTGQLVADMAYKSLSENVNKMIHGLEQSISRAQETINAYGRKERLFSKGFIASVLVAALIGGGVACMLTHYFYPAMDLKMRTRLNMGERLERAWSKLSKAEQDRLNSLL